MRAHKTVDEVAQVVGVDPKTVQRWLQGRVPHARHRWAVAQLLNMREEDLWHIPELSKPPSVEILMPYTHVSQPSSSSQESTVVDTGSEVFSSLTTLEMLMKTRRQVLKEMLSTACAAFTLSPSAVLWQDTRERFALIEACPSYIDAEALNNLVAITQHYWKLSESSSIDILSGIAGHFATIIQLLNASHPTKTYEKLCTLASENALLMGKTFYEIREYDLAWDYYKFSLKVARDVHNPDLWAAGSGWIALLHIYWGQPQHALPLLHEVQRQELQNQRLRAWLSAIEAEIYAKLGDADACMRCLDKSKGISLPLSLADDVYRTGFDLSRSAGYEGSCFVLLRQPERALPALNEASRLCDPASLHRRAMHLADRGSVYAQLGDVQTACSFMLDALDVTEQSKSLVGLQKVYKGRKELDSWKDNGEVKSLDERIAGTLHLLTSARERAY
ncbi:MAG TPA: helix-turn-helix domain-containing protein [Ktedonobacteraceae bacterium]|nr:helix-turn-helix domain-containing protein [Ktedonobacteraceae bacterium]